MKSRCNATPAQLPIAAPVGRKFLVSNSRDDIPLECKTNPYTAATDEIAAPVALMGDW